MWAIYNAEDIRVSRLFMYPDEANEAVLDYPPFYYVAWEDI